MVVNQKIKIDKFEIKVNTIKLYDDRMFERNVVETI